MVQLFGPADDDDDNEEEDEEEDGEIDDVDVGGFAAGSGLDSSGFFVAKFYKHTSVFAAAVAAAAATAAAASRQEEEGEEV